eukprot:CAMPEP_0172443634 /NCGR_PEP_ID=MMETSP1065-20121228/3871_1 /TAXON_ID=265537 /ORGANISM="Amphiprora paludosa, Strain CCMP125" /LENGTH=362 /DNA_ID=CAMNT_0013193937 /DNA_START=103 /DNA_END=1191 /DNA_ORIENTATION=+
MATESAVSSPPLQLSDNWRNPQLTPIGLYYPLGNAQTRFSLGDLNQVLETLRHVFFKLSLHTKYHNSPISAECQSMDQVTFEVVLFASRDHDDQVILEVSKRDGDSHLYQRYARQILSAVEGEPADNMINSPSGWNANSFAQADNISRIGLCTDESINEALESVWNMLSTDRYDARKLALECLTHMTDPNKSGWSTAKAFAERLLHPNGLIQEQLSKFVLDYASRDISGMSDSLFDMNGMDDLEDSKSFETYMEADFGYLGLMTLSQTLQIAAVAKTLDVKSFLDMYSMDLVGSIMQKVDDVQQRPHHAYFAVQSLAALCDCVPTLRCRIKGAHVQEAQLVGESSHLALATISEKLLVSLQA